MDTMSFSIKLVLPKTRQPDGINSEPPDEALDELIDDDITRPSFLVNTCRCFAEKGVRFELAGLFAEPLPVTVRIDLPYLLEQLPAVVEFFLDPSTTEFNLSLWGQGIETEFSFLKRDADKMIQITGRSSIDRPMRNKAELISRDEFVDQIVAFVEAYNLAVSQYLPNLANHPWNQRLLIESYRLKAAAE